MKIINKITKVFIIILMIYACTDDDNLSFLDNIPAPSNVSAVFNITQDNTGVVTIMPVAEGATVFDIYFGDGTVEPETINQGNAIEHTYLEGTYQVKVVASNIKGDTVEITEELMVSFKAPENLVVSIENDAAISKQVNVTATADFATVYEFYSGEDGVTQPVVTSNIGEAVSYVYANPGIYAIKVVAKGGAVDTTEYAADFEVTEILAPIISASIPSTREDEDVISIFSDKYTDIADTDFNPNWSQSTLYNVYDLNGDKMIQYSNLNYQGIDIGSEIDASSMEMLHIDIWTTDATSIDIFPLPNGVQPEDERFVTKTLVADQWNSFDIPMSEFTSQGLSVDKLKQFKFVGSGTIFIDNLYFYKQGSGVIFDDGLLTNGDFENGSDSWLIGVDDSTSAPVVTEGGNTYYSVDVTAAGNSYDVNTSQKVEIIQGNTYTLTFDAWSNVNRGIIAGIGLSKDPWTNKSETVNITTSKTTYSLTLSAAEFGATDARVIFDLGAEIGIVNIDNVSLIIGTGNIVVNGDFENGSDSWLIGVDTSTSAPVVTEGGNTYYSVNVTAAGNAYDVNASQILEIIQGNTYTLTFDAWSDVNRGIFAGIGLSKDPWTNTVETVNITSTRTTYTLTLTATEFGAADARIIFDLGAEIGMVNIDDVSLSSN
ncbi:Carbohydrate binding domain-containing protein [Polaribacter sp. KT25b]|uniref:carbohydrate binding domain-containing protein n=1 Tax=Polaribacter sp. KT25b TaxID=1855336 RepID=UPI00087BAB13|nr:carbohydrate binding domain-containing protein [Polaribacter sp. KT25b]SDR87297.1 Carbohydrate binding domain-containing protein [Polaribacter sp. KT25b]